MGKTLQEIDMPLVSRVVSATEGKVQLQLGVSEMLNVFEGHFEQAPIVPGVVQIYWALALCNEYLRKISARNIERVDALKFQNVIQPGAELQLALELKSDKLLFAFTSDIGRHSSGKIILD